MVPGQMIGIVITITIAPDDDGLFSLLSTAIVNNNDSHDWLDNRTGRL